MKEQAVHKKDPVSVLDWMFDFSKWLKNGDTILDADVTTEDEGIILTGKAINPTNVVIVVSGGEVLRPVKVRCKIVTAHGLTTIRTLKILIEET